MSRAFLSVAIPEIHLDEVTIERLDSLRVDDEPYDEIVTELLDIHVTEEFTLQFGGDKLP